MLYFCAPPNVVKAVHTDEQIYLDPVAYYGIGTYVIVDKLGPAPAQDYYEDPATPGVKIPIGYQYPTISAQMQADSTKLECRRRITAKVSDQAQRNITTHVTDLQTKLIQTPPLTTEEQADIDTAGAIWVWIGAAARDAASMLGTCDALITANDLEWYLDVKWPPWNSAWDTFVVRF